MKIEIFFVEYVGFLWLKILKILKKKLEQLDNTFPSQIHQLYIKFVILNFNISLRNGKLFNRKFVIKLSVQHFLVTIFRVHIRDFSVQRFYDGNFNLQYGWFVSRDLCTHFQRIWNYWFTNSNIDFGRDW